MAPDIFWLTFRFYKRQGMPLFRFHATKSSYATSKEADQTVVAYMRP